MSLNINQVIVNTPSSFEDYRGSLWTIWKEGDYNLSFNHDKVSTSSKNVLRGIHGDFKSHKLISCLYGKLYLVIVDNRKDSSTYMKWDSIILSSDNKKQILLPPGVGNGFYVLSDESVFHYKWAYEGEYHDVEQQFTLKWNDPKIGIDWPCSNPILSKRDRL